MGVLANLYQLHHLAVRMPRFERLAVSLAGMIPDCHSLLDVGAHDGRVARRLAQHVDADRVMGVDVHVHPSAEIEVMHFDGERLPFEDDSFDAVILSDVLHHAAAPGRLLAESIRVCRTAVAVKDHFQFGRVSSAALWAMDVAGNARDGIHVRGRYFDAPTFLEMVERGGGSVKRLHWPLRIHTTPIEWVLSSGWQFTARIEPAHPREGRGAQ